MAGLEVSSDAPIMVLGAGYAGLRVAQEVSRRSRGRLPVVLAGSLGGTLATGRVLDYGNKDVGHRKLCSMYLGIMDRMGVKLDRFGDASERLADF